MAKKYEKVDGFGPKERKRVHSAIRQVWYQSTPRRLAIKRCLDGDGFLKCEKCGKRVPKLHVDHIKPVGALDEGNAIKRLFCPSAQLQCWCHACHREKTKREAKGRARGRKRLPSRKLKKEDFTDQF